MIQALVCIRISESNARKFWGYVLCHGFLNQPVQSGCFVLVDNVDIFRFKIIRDNSVSFFVSFEK